MSRVRTRDRTAVFSVCALALGLAPPADAAPDRAEHETFKPSEPQRLIRRHVQTLHPLLGLAPMPLKEPHHTPLLFSQAITHSP